MIFFLRSYILRTDSRLLRYIHVCQSKNLSRHVVCWDKKHTEIDQSGVTYYRLSAIIGGGILNIVSLIRWNLFLFIQLFRSRKSIVVVHAIDFDTMLPALVFCKLFKKRFIFDVYDKYTDTRGFSGVVARIIDWLENIGCGQADLLLLPDECRIKQMGIKHERNLLIIENVPVFSGQPTAIEIGAEGKLKLAYVGTLEPENRGIEDLMMAVSRRPNVSLEIAGVGPVSELCEEFSRKFENINFHGPVTPEEAMVIMGESHIIVGMYYLTVPNHKFAAPNKYYEHLALGRPLLTTKGTPPGEKVTELGSGWAISEGEASIAQFLEKVSASEVFQKGERARSAWLAHYANYFNDVLLEEYGGFLLTGRRLI